MASVIYYKIYDNIESNRLPSLLTEVNSYLIYSVAIPMRVAMMFFKLSTERVIHLHGYKLFKNTQQQQFWEKIFLEIHSHSE